jgi:WD40 repeat protein
VHELIATGSFDNSVHVFNILNGSKFWEFQTAENVLSLDWSPNGSLLGCTSKDKLVHVLDPRSTEKKALSVAAHEGLKSHKMVWLDNEFFSTTGFSKSNERQVRLWDSRNLTKEYIINIINIEFNHYLLIMQVVFYFLIMMLIQICFTSQEKYTNK